jgi:hypothetical protein
LGGEIEDTFGVKAAAEVLDNEDVTVMSEFDPAGGHGRGRFGGDAVGSTFKEDGQRSGLIKGCDDGGLEVDAIAHGDHDLFESEGGFFGFRRSGDLGNGR